MTKTVKLSLLGTTFMEGYFPRKVWSPDISFISSESVNIYYRLLEMMCLLTLCKSSIAMWMPFLIIVTCYLLRIAQMHVREQPQFVLSPSVMTERPRWSIQNPFSASELTVQGKTRIPRRFHHRTSFLRNRKKKKKKPSQDAGQTDQHREIMNSISDRWIHKYTDKKCQQAEEKNEE